jgi:hypothetical protein
MNDMYRQQGGVHIGSATTIDALNVIVVLLTPQPESGF